MKRSRRRYAGLTPAELHVMVDTMADIGDRLSVDWEDITRRITAALPGQPGAQSYDRPVVSRGTRATPWCDVCEAERCEHVHGLDEVTEGPRAGTLILWCRTMDIAAEYCGHRLEQALQRPDPTGAAAELADRAAGDLAENAKDIKTAFDALVRVSLRASQYGAHAAPSAHRREVERVNEASGRWLCWSCLRVKVESEPLTKSPSTVSGNLPVARLLCRWCTDVVKTTGDVPGRKQVRAHAEGKRVVFVVDGDRISA